MMRVMAPEVSVVVPTHDRSRLLGLTLRSILWQRDVDLEVIVVDDGSADDPAAVVAGLGDARVRLVRHARPLGVSVARNRGIAEARGGWVGFCDDDDLWSPDKLHQQLAAASGCTWVCTGHVNVTPGMRVVGGGPAPTSEEIVRLLPYRNVVPGGGSAVIVRSDALEVCGGFDGRLRNAADWELWLRLSGHGPPAVVDRPLVAYRLHPGNASLDGALTLREVEIIEQVHRIRVSRASLYRYLGWWALRTGRRRSAVGHFLHGLQHRDALYGLSDGIHDLAYVVQDTAVSLATGGRWRARARSRDETRTAIGAWRQEAQAWVDNLVERSGGSWRGASHA
jgi:glycosyltransferase involved in cell wall biosynthesis